MSTAALTTILKMVESLPEDAQERLVDHIREFIADLEDETHWEASFQQTQDNLVAAARKAREEIAKGKATPMDYNQL